MNPINKLSKIIKILIDLNLLNIFTQISKLNKTKLTLILEPTLFLISLGQTIKLLLWLKRQPKSFLYLETENNEIQETTNKVLKNSSRFQYNIVSSEFISKLKLNRGKKKNLIFSHVRKKNKYKKNRYKKNKYKKNRYKKKIKLYQIATLYIQISSVRLLSDQQIYLFSNSYKKPLLLNSISLNSDYLGGYTFYNSISELNQVAFLNAILEKFTHKKKLLSN
jgi:hypothetical protein